MDPALDRRIRRRPRLAVPALERGYAAPIWMTFKQALELGGAVRKGEKGSPVVCANTLTRTETDEAAGEDAEVAIPFL